MRATFPLASLAAAGAGLLAYARFVEPRWLQTTHTEVAVPGLPEPLDGLRIVLLADFHVGAGTPLRLVEAAVERTCRARPHLVAIVGDLSDDPPPGFDGVAKMLSRLEAPLGVYAVPGNHDYDASGGIARWREAVDAYPHLVDLTNRAVTLRHEGAPLTLIGLDDLARGRPAEGLTRRDAEGPVVVLAHEPSHAEQLERADLVLSGHTHGGQVRLPFLGPLVNPSPKPERYDSGLVRLGDRQVYVSRGVGTGHAPLRLGSRPEVAVLTLRLA